MALGRMLVLQDLECSLSVSQRAARVGCGCEKLLLLGVEVDKFSFFYFKIFSQLVGVLLIPGVPSSM